jgi:predicted aspartyl protease
MLQTLKILLFFFSTISFTKNDTKRIIASTFHHNLFFGDTTHKNNPLQKLFSDDPIVSSDTPSCIIPFNRAGNLILIKAKADTIEGNFILDTGAPGLILNMTYFRNYPQTTETEGETGGITGSTTVVSATSIATLHMGPIKYKKVNADRINLGHLENSKGVKILGLLGMQLFKQFEMIIDYEKSVIYLHLIAKKEAKTYKSDQFFDTSKYNVFDISISDNKLFTKGQIANKKLTFVIDTGAESNVIDSRLPNTLFENFNIAKRVNLTGAGNKKIEAIYGDMQTVNVGSLSLYNVPLLVTNLEKMCYAYDKCVDGILGFDFLSLNKIGFNFVTNKMYIWK